MQGEAKIIEELNTRLAEELTAVNQYMVHAEMCENWGYERLHGMIRKRSIDEMKHAEKLIQRILFLEGMPLVNKLKEIHIGKDVQAQIANDRGGEDNAVLAYNKAIQEATEFLDNGTRDLLESILEDEEKHIDWLEAQLDQIAQLGIQNYLSEQVKS